MTIKTWNDRLPKTKEVTAHDRRWAMEAEIDELRAKLDQALEDAINFEARAYKAEAKLAELEPATHNCNRHPLAPHGYMRNASHNAGRYVCECEFWTPGEES